MSGAAAAAMQLRANSAPTNEPSDLLNSRIRAGLKYRMHPASVQWIIEVTSTVLHPCFLSTDVAMVDAVII